MKDRLGNEVPEHAIGFARYVSRHGWHYLREWVPEWEDEEGLHGGFWSETIWHEKPAAYPREEGIWAFWMEVSGHIVAHESAWQFFLDFAAECSERDRISCRVPFMYDPPAEFLASLETE